MSQALQRTDATEPATQDLDCRIVVAVADAQGVEPLELDERLYDVVDADAISKLFSSRPGAGSPVRGEVSFTLDRCHVTVYDDLSVTVRTREDVAN